MSGSVQLWEVHPHLPSSHSLSAACSRKRTYDARRTHVRCNYNEAPHDNLWPSERAVPAGWRLSS